MEGGIWGFYDTSPSIVYCRQQTITVDQPSIEGGIWGFYDTSPLIGRQQTITVDQCPIEGGIWGFYDRHRRLYIVGSRLFLLGTIPFGV
jgi:hypothetical protein